MVICWRCDLTGTAGLRLPPPFPGHRDPPAGLCGGGGGEEPPPLLAVPSVTGMVTRSLLVAPPGAAGCGGSSWRLRCPGAEAKSCSGGCSPQSPRRGWPPSPPSPLQPIDPCPDRWALPCGRGAVLPGRAGEMAFRRAWSGIQHRSLVPRQRSIRPVISRAWAGRGAGKCQAGTGCPGCSGAAQLTHPTLHIHRPFPASVSQPRAGVGAVPA